MKNCLLFRSRLALLLLLAVFAALRPAFAQEGGGNSEMVIRDTEIENDIKGWIRPVIVAGGLDPADIHVILIQSDQVNSFVAGGPNIFIYTGLLLKTDNVGEVIGVLAHELGHIRGGHLIRGGQAIGNASYESLIGTILGVGAAILTHNGAAMAAVSGGAQDMAMRNYLSFSRTQEASADHSALTTLNKACLSPKGLMTFMQKLGNQELLPESQQDPYLQTHPLSRERVEYIAAGYDRAPCKDKPFPPDWVDQYKRTIAKLKGFITPQRVPWDYSDRDRSIYADYARAIAAYRENHVDEALNDADGLLRLEPKNPWFLELKGQMLSDFGRVEESLAPYKESIDLRPDSPLIRTAYANSLIQTSDKDRTRLDGAITQLDRAARDEPRSPLIFHLLATAWGKKGQEPMARLYLAEEALLANNKGEARNLAKTAQQGLQKGSRPWLRAQDILTLLQHDDSDGRGDKKD